MSKDQYQNSALIEANCQIGRSIFFEASATTKEFNRSKLDVRASDTLIASYGFEAPASQIRGAGADSVGQVFSGGGGSGGGGGFGCPHIDEWVLIGTNKAVKAKTLLKGNHFLYNPITRSLNKLVQATLVENQPLYLITTNRGAKSIVSQSDKVITSVYDLIGKSLTEYKSGSIISSNGDCIYTDDFTIFDVGFGDVVVISLEKEFIYASGSSKNNVTLRHNRKNDRDPGDDIIL